MATIKPQPYGSFVLAERAVGAVITHVEQDEIMEEFLALVSTALADSGSAIQGAANVYGPETYNNIDIRGRWFEVRTPSKWEPSLYDSKNELLLISVRGNRIAFYSSDSAMRRVLLANISNPTATGSTPKLAGFSKISSSRLTATFLENVALKAMWLSGTHRSVQVKADSKVLSGSDLKYALDPLGDSSYLAAAARNSSMGVSLRGSAVWTKPNKTIVSFAADVEDIFQKLDSSGTNESMLPILANELNSFNDVQSPFDFDVAAPEALRLKRQQRAAENLTGWFSFSISTSTANAPANHDFDLDIAPRNPPPGAAGPVILKLQIQPVFSTTHSDSAIKFNVSIVGGPVPPWAHDLVDALNSHPEVFRVFYGSGHTIAAGALSVSHPMDIDFTDWKWIPFGAMPGHPASLTVDVSAEKPVDNDLENIWMSLADRSLFGWLVRSLSNGATSAALDLQPLNANGQDVWLFCDDDAGEVADFVHVFLPPTGIPKITLIHVKGANNESPNREMVAGPYEVVCGQAMKNLRYLTASNLIARICDRIYDDKRPLWNVPFVQNTPPKGDRDTFYGVLQSIDTHAEYSVLIVQPHVTKTAYDQPINKPLNKNSRLGSVQLRTLLFATKAAASAVSSEFTVIGCL